MIGKIVGVCIGFDCPIIWLGSVWLSLGRLCGLGRSGLGFGGKTRFRWILERIGPSRC